MASKQTGALSDRVQQDPFGRGAAGLKVDCTVTQADEVCAQLLFTKRAGGSGALADPLPVPRQTRFSVTWVLPGQLSIGPSSHDGRPLSKRSLLPGRDTCR